MSLLRFVANQVDSWHRAFQSIVGKIAEEGNKLLPLARHVVVHCGLTYPNPDEIDRPDYIDSLATPHGQLSYDRIFDKALDHVIEGWHLIASGVFEGNNSYQSAFGNWNLDTGRDDTGRLVLWS